MFPLYIYISHYISILLHIIIKNITMIVDHIPPIKIVAPTIPTSFPTSRRCLTETRPRFRDAQKFADGEVPFVAMNALVAWFPSIKPGDFIGIL